MQKKKKNVQLSFFDIYVSKLKLFCAKKETICKLMQITYLGKYNDPNINKSWKW